MWFCVILLNMLREHSDPLFQSSPYSHWLLKSNSHSIIFGSHKGKGSNYCTMRKLLLNTLFWLLDPPGVPGEAMHVRLKRDVGKWSKCKPSVWRVYKVFLALDKSNKQNHLWYQHVKRRRKYEGFCSLQSPQLEVWTHWGALMIPRNTIHTNGMTSRNKGKEFFLVFVDILFLGLCFIYYLNAENCNIWAR